MFFWSRKIKLIIEPRKRLSTIHFQKGSLDEIGKTLKKYGKKYAVLIDEGVEKLFGKEIRKILKNKMIEAKYFEVPSGEKFKNLSTLEKLAEELIKNDITRSEIFVAIGGGMTTDLVGFLAATYMRGAAVIHIPTTILGMVDAAIGGKNGVNLPTGKNLIGTVHQPKAVLINPFFLKSINENQLRNSLAEIIKIAIIRDKNLFKLFERKKEKIFALDPKILSKILERGVELKLEIVSRDEQESGLRMMLNYGHTVGHAIEKLSNYKLSHGEAIAIGMVEENNWAVTHRILRPKDADRIKNVFELYGLPTQVPKKMKPAEIAEMMTHDKKRKDGVLYLCVPKKIGKGVIVQYHED